MIIVISGSVGVGKTTIAKELSKKLKYELVNLNEWAKEFKTVEISNLQTFDFDLDKLLLKIEGYIKKNKNKDIILESHFAHYISPKLVDKLIIINRDLKELKKEYSNRGYNKKKQEDNLEVESFNLCFYEAEEEGYSEKQIIVIENKEDLKELIKKIYMRLNK